MQQYPCLGFNRKYSLLSNIKNRRICFVTLHKINVDFVRTSNVCILQLIQSSLFKGPLTLIHLKTSIRVRLMIMIMTVIYIKRNIKVIGKWVTIFHSHTDQIYSHETV